jgi:hypothetical protein
MKTFAALALLGMFAAVAALGASRPVADDDENPRLAHMVFFTLKDQSAASLDKFADSCHEYLADIPGVVYFSVGKRAEDVEEPGVTVKDFDVALHAVFENKEAKEKYLVHEKHKKFVEVNRENFAKVRVFDSYLTKP